MRKCRNNMNIIDEGQVSNPAALLMAAVVLQAKNDCMAMSKNREYYNRKSRQPDQELLLSIPSMERWLNDPGVVEFWISWQNEIDAQAVRDELRRTLYETVPA